MYATAAPLSTTVPIHDSTNDIHPESDRRGAS